MPFGNSQAGNGDLPSPDQGMENVSFLWFRRMETTLGVSLVWRETAQGIFWALLAA